MDAKPQPLPLSNAAYEEYCGRCIHAVRSMQLGTVCGLTGSKRDISSDCADLVIDVAMEKELAERAERWEQIQELDSGNVSNPELDDILKDGSITEPSGGIRWKGLLGIVLLIVVATLKFCG